MPLGVGGAYAAVVRVHADADGLSYRTLLRRRSARWEDIADVRVYLQRGRHSDIYRVEVVTRGGPVRRLSVPVGPSSGGTGRLRRHRGGAARAARRHGTPETGRRGRPPDRPFPGVHRLQPRRLRHPRGPRP
ncbi:PH domain-containing protein [Streptomyces althioticus]